MLSLLRIWAACQACIFVVTGFPGYRKIHNSSNWLELAELGRLPLHIGEVPVCSEECLGCGVAFLDMALGRLHVSNRKRTCLVLFGGFVRAWTLCGSIQIFSVSAYFSCEADHL